MEYNLTGLFDLCLDKNKLLEQLQKWKIVPRVGEYGCPQCGALLKLGNDTSRCDGFRWRCHNKLRKSDKKRLTRCDTSVEFRHKTLFARSKLPMFKMLGFINLWLDSVAITIISKQMHIAMATCVGWATFYRESILDAFIVSKVKLGGPGKLVDIYQSKFDRGRFHRGQIVEGQYVFGGFERETGRIFMICVDELGDYTLLPVIKDWILEDTTIVSDYWNLKNCSSLKGYEQLRENYGLSYKDPEKVSQENYIIPQSNVVKSYMLQPKQQKIHIPSYLAFYLFQKRCHELHLDAMDEFFRLISQLYDPK